MQEDAELRFNDDGIEDSKSWLAVYWLSEETDDSARAQSREFNGCEFHFL
jgi:hypothetical protein